MPLNVVKCQAKSMFDVATKSSFNYIRVGTLEQKNPDIYVCKRCELLANTWENKGSVHKTIYFPAGNMTYKKLKKKKPLPYKMPNPENEISYIEALYGKKKYDAVKNLFLLRQLSNISTE